MTDQELYDVLQRATTAPEVEQALDTYEAEHPSRVAWVPVGGRENNRGAVEVSADPGRALVERLTNGIDAVLEAEHDAHNGIPVVPPPRKRRRRG